MRKLAKPTSMLTFTALVDAFDAACGKRSPSRLGSDYEHAEPTLQVAWQVLSHWVFSLSISALCTK